MWLQKVGDIITNTQVVANTFFFNVNLLTGMHIIGLTNPIYYKLSRRFTWFRRLFFCILRGRQQMRLVREIKQNFTNPLYGCFAVFSIACGKLLSGAAALCVSSHSIMLPRFWFAVLFYSNNAVVLNVHVVVCFKIWTA